MVIVCVFVVQLSMVSTRGGAYGSGSDAGAASIDERLRKFITYEITHGIMESTPVIFDTIKEGIMELLDERLGALRAEIALGQLGARTPSFREFKACGALEFFGAKDPIASHGWITDMENAQRTSFYPKGVKVGSVTCLLRDRARDWWEEGGCALGTEAVCRG